MSKSMLYGVLFITISFLVAVSCKNDESYSSIYMPGKSVINVTFDKQDTFKYCVSLTGGDYPTVSASLANDVTVHFRIDSSLVAKYNETFGTNYNVLPSGNFTYESSAIILKGQAGVSGLNLVVSNGEQLPSFSTYLIPLTIDRVSGANISDAQSTTYFVLTHSPSIENMVPYSQAGWSVVDFDTEAPEEGNGNGLAINVLDGESNTFWHSKWAGGESQMPHWLVIDMGTSQNLHGLSFIGRQSDNNGKPKTVEVYVSNDKTNSGDFNWGKKAGTLILQNVNTEQRYFLSLMKSNRYFKILIKNSYGNTRYTHLAELRAF